MPTVLRALVISLAFAAGVAVAVLVVNARINPGNTTDKAKSIAPERDPEDASDSVRSPSLSRPSQRPRVREATLDEKLTLLEGMLQAERSKNADLAREIAELRSNARANTNALAPLDEPRRWLETLLPNKFAGLTVTELRHMRELDLSSSKLDVHDLAYLSQLPALRWLTLRRTAVDDGGLSYLLRVPSLVRLGLRETKVTDAGMPTLGAMKGLEHLDLNMLPVTDKGLAHLRGLQSLSFLRLNYTKVTDVGMMHVAQLRALERLDLWGTAVTDKGLERLWHLPALRHLELGATAVSKGWVERFSRDHPHCYVRSRHGR